MVSWQYNVLTPMAFMPRGERGCSLWSHFGSHFGILADNQERPPREDQSVVFLSVDFTHPFLIFCLFPASLGKMVDSQKPSFCDDLRLSAEGMPATAVTSHDNSETTLQGEHMDPAGGGAGAAHPLSPFLGVAGSSRLSWSELFARRGRRVMSMSSMWVWFSRTACTSQGATST